jgi:hypothetical protein
MVAQGDRLDRGDVGDRDAMSRRPSTRAGDVIIAVLFQVEDKRLVVAAFANGGHRGLAPAFTFVQRSEKQHLVAVEAVNPGADQLVVAARDLDIAGRDFDAVGRGLAGAGPGLQQRRRAAAQKRGRPGCEADYDGQYRGLFPAGVAEFLPFDPVAVFDLCTGVERSPGQLFDQLRR